MNTIALVLADQIQKRLAPVAPREDGALTIQVEGGLQGGTVRLSTAHHLDNAQGLLSEPLSVPLAVGIQLGEPMFLESVQGKVQLSPVCPAGKEYTYTISL